MTGTDFMPLWLDGRLGLDAGLHLDLGGVQVFGLDGKRRQVAAGDTAFILAAGDLDLTLPMGPLRLRSGMFCVAPEGVGIGCGVGIEGGAGLAIVVTGYRGVFQVGGPPEARGRLRYIDGCTDTLLVCPPRLGEACLNHLHIPAGTLQSAHVHTTDRIGVIARGHGTCHTHSGEHALAPGLGWWIPAGVRHHFATGLASLDVLAWHPDSDFGPTDGDHPMVNRTLVSR